MSISNPAAVGLPQINVPADVALKGQGDEVMLEEGDEQAVNFDNAHQQSDVFHRLQNRGGARRKLAASPRSDNGVVLQNQNSREY